MAAQRRATSSTRSPLANKARGRWHRLLNTVFLLLAVALLPGSTWAEAQRESLCTAGERTFFLCDTGQRLVAICGGKTQKAGYVQLRLGQPGRLEAAWPPPDARERGISKSELISQQGLGNYVRFAVDDDALVVFAVTGGESGLVTVEASKVRTKELCRKKGTNALRKVPAPTGSIFAISNPVPAQTR